MRMLLHLATASTSTSTSLCVVTTTPLTMPMSRSFPAKVKMSSRPTDVFLHSNATIPRVPGRSASTSIFPFRGYAGIGVTSQSRRITITGNIITGDTTTVGGKYQYACDYGIAVGNHPVNAPSTPECGDCVISGNTIYEVINSDKQIFLPKYQVTFPSLENSLSCFAAIQQNLVAFSLLP